MTLVLGLVLVALLTIPAAIAVRPLLALMQRPVMPRHLFRASLGGLLVFSLVACTPERPASPGGSAPPAVTAKIDWVKAGYIALVALTNGAEIAGKLPHDKAILVHQLLDDVYRSLQLAMGSVGDPVAAKAYAERAQASIEQAAAIVPGAQPIVAPAP